MHDKLFNKGFLFAFLFFYSALSTAQDRLPPGAIARFEIDRKSLNDFGDGEISTKVACSNDGNQITVTNKRNNRIVTWNVQTGRMVSELLPLRVADKQGLPTNVYHELSPTGRWAVRRWATEPLQEKARPVHYFELRDLVSGKVLHQEKQETYFAYSPVFSASEARFAVFDQPKAGSIRVRIFDLSTNKAPIEKDLNVTQNNIGNQWARFTPDGGFLTIPVGELINNEHRQSLVLVETKNGNLSTISPQRTFDGPAFSLNKSSEFLAYATHTSFVIENLRTRRLVENPMRRAGRFSLLAGPAPHSGLLVGTMSSSGEGEDEAFSHWLYVHESDGPSGRELTLPLVNPDAHLTWVTSVAFCGDGRRFVTGTGGGFVYVWDLWRLLQTDEAQRYTFNEAWQQLGSNKGERAFGAMARLLNSQDDHKSLAERVKNFSFSKAPLEKNQLETLLRTEIPRLSDPFRVRAPAQERIEQALAPIDNDQMLTHAIFVVRQLLREAPDLEARRRIGVVIERIQQQQARLLFPEAQSDALRIKRARQVLELIRRQ